MHEIDSQPFLCTQYTCQILSPNVTERAPPFPTHYNDSSMSALSFTRPIPWQNSQQPPTRKLQRRVVTQTW